MLNGVLYIIPHSFIKLPLSGGATTQFVSTTIENSDFTTLSPTVLRRSSQLELDETFDIIAKFRLSQEDFFLGYELGPRQCGLLTLPEGTVSMLMPPESPVSARVDNVSLTFTPQYMYIYYFPESKPCLFLGNANQKGEAVAVPSRTSSPTPSVSPSFTPFPRIISLGVAVPSSSSPVPSSASALSSTLPPTNEPVCFPTGGTVKTATGKKLRMDALKVGEQILVDVTHGTSGPARVFSEVFAFTHSDAVAVHSFTQLRTDTNLTVELTPGRFIYAIGKAVPAQDVREGDWVMDGVVGRQVCVYRARMVIRQGLYNPQTYHGNLVVDGVVATTYSSSFYDMRAAHALLAPVRFDVDCVSGHSEE